MFLVWGVSGESSSYVPGAIRSRRSVTKIDASQALDRMIDEARAMGADAIIGLRFMGTEISQGAAEVLAYGTAVKLVRE